MRRPSPKLLRVSRGRSEVAQELYDGQGKKIITYPRAEVRYLPESLIADVPKVVAGLQVGQSFKAIPVPDPPIIRRGASGTFHEKGLEGASHHAVIPNANTVDTLREVWPRLSIDEKKLFDVIARAYLAALMPDFRYRQTTATLDVKGFPFKATGRQPIDLGWRAAFPEWQPSDEKGDGGQLLPAMRDGETARLHDPAVETKETKPPPRYNEGTLIEAMQNAWRFVDDEALRDRLKEAKGIGTPATRAEIIGGLKRQDFLVAQGKNIVPTETGLKLFGVLKQADPALVDPGVTAQLECLLDDVVVGKQEMMGTIDAVCDVALRIIGKLTHGPASGGPPLLGLARGGSGGERPPTPAMKQFAVVLARQKRIRLPAGYGTSESICRAFLEQHAPKKTGGETAAAPASKATSPAQASRAEGAQPTRKRRRAKDATAPAPSPTKAVRGKKPRKPAFGNPPSKAPGLQLHDVGRNTPLRIPYGNKDVAQKLGARYGADGWYAPPGVDLLAFKENGWL